MKLNRRGYLTVEIIIASVVAVTIAFFLMEITIKLVNITDDAYVSTELLTDKALIIKNIKELLEEDIEKGDGIKSIELTSNGLMTIDFCKEDDSMNEIYYDRYMYIYNDRLVYEDTIDGVEIYNRNLSGKYLNGYVVSSNRTGTISNNEYILFKITADNKFSKEKFVANIMVRNNKTC